MKPKAQREKSGQAGTREQGRVLLITDDPEGIDHVSLEAAGLEIVGVCSGAAALLALQRSRPQIVIASTATEKISTRELACMLGQMRDGIPLISVGKEASSRERRKSTLADGAFDYFQLPDETELLVLRTVQLAAVSQTMDRLRAEADLDHLTGLANRRRFRVALAREVERWRRYGVPCALLLLDVDHMKAINDKRGHPAGDLVIRHIANTLVRVSRDNDTAARLGGEEFALLLAGIGDKKASLAAERLRGILAQEPVTGVGNVSVSIGVAACPAHANSERTLYSASDKALYVAKNEGRNRVAVAPLLQENLPGV